MTGPQPTTRTPWGRRPAPVIYQMTHPGWRWQVFDVTHGYDLYRDALPGTADYPKREYVDSYWLRYFAKRRCDRGNL